MFQFQPSNRFGFDYYSRPDSIYWVLLHKMSFTVIYDYYRLHRHCRLPFWARIDTVAALDLTWKSTVQSSADSLLTWGFPITGIDSANAVNTTIKIDLLMLLI